MARLPSEEIVDAEYEEVPSQQVSRPSPRADVYPLAQDEAGQWFDPALVPVQGSGFQFTPEMARTISLFVKVPLLAYVALNKDVPSFIRLAAAGLALLEAKEIARQSPQIEQMLPPFEFHF